MFLFLGRKLLFRVAEILQTLYYCIMFVDENKNKGLVYLFKPRDYTHPVLKKYRIFAALSQESAVSLKYAIRKILTNCFIRQKQSVFLKAIALTSIRIVQLYILRFPRKLKRYSTTSFGTSYEITI